MIDQFPYIENHSEDYIVREYTMRCSFFEYELIMANIKKQKPTDNVFILKSEFNTDKGEIFIKERVFNKPRTRE